MGIQRYDCGNGEGMFYNGKDGEWVDYLTHNDIVEKLEVDKKALTEQLALCSITNCASELKRPSPYKWIKEEKFKIKEGESYNEPRVNLIQCASWISEYVKKYCL